MKNQAALPGQWWGKFDFSTGETRYWQLGPMEMWIARQNAEFRVSVRRTPDGDDTLLKTGALYEDDVPEDVETVRYGISDAVEYLKISPVAADRAAIVKAGSPFIVPPGGSTTAFISSPVCIHVHLPDPVRLMHEEATFRPSDTWFGPSTIEGELCYSIRTSVRFNIENLPQRPYRAVSVVRIFNHADTPLPLDRLRLPLPYLTLYAGKDGRLWTESITLDRTGNDDFANIKLGEDAPREAGPCVMIANPREKMDKQHPIKSFTSLFGLRKGREGYERVVE